mgnify:FL=1
MQCRGSRRAFTTAGEESGLMPGYGMKRGSRTVLFLVAHALRRSQFSPSESLLRPSLRFRSVFPVENFTMRKFSTGNRRENAESRRDGRTLMRKGKIVRFVNTISSDGIAYLLLHLFQLMGQDFHVAADLLVGYPGIYLGGFQIRMPQKTAYGLDGHTVREQHGGGVRMPGNMIGQPYLETALPAKFLQYGVASAVARYRKYMVVLGQPLVLLYDAPGNVQQADVGLGVRLAPAGDDPEVAVEEGLEPVGRQRLHVRVCQSGEHREDEEVTYQFAGPAFHRGLHQRLYLTLRQVAPVNALGGVDVPGEGVEGKRTAVAGDGDDVLEPDHVTPYGIGAAFLLRTQEILEVVDERQVEFLQGDVVTAVHFRDELAQMPVYGTVAVVCSLHAAVSHFLDELLIVLLEELQQRLAFYAQPEAGVPQPGGGDIAVGLHQFLVTTVHVHTYPVNRRIDFLRLGALARGTCRFHVPKFRGHVQLAAELLDFAVHRKTAHQGEIAVGSLAALLHVEEDFEGRSAHTRFHTFLIVTKLISSELSSGMKNCANY